MQHILYDKFSYDKFYLLVHVNVSEKGVYRRHGNRWEICLRMRYNFRGLRERDLGRVNIVIWFLSVLLVFLVSFFLLTKKLLIHCIVGNTRKVWKRSEDKKMYKIATFA